MYDFCLDTLDKKMKSEKTLPRQFYLADFFVKKNNLRTFLYNELLRTNNDRYSSKKFNIIYMREM